ncbi:exo-beta-glucanase [Colletotrichum truncatum]|uniref:Exo-beta-glucanase n=1 Tax=Colletotrichum truncatum TaxID=5467 RepID=A0ACC3ZKT8_COLTU|nr:exo-beta-glucanase [Colletotrichum truncatum]KAF6800087.1 exo-beta-glucanase [Colletotrichum truncatum]
MTHIRFFSWFLTACSAQQPKDHDDLPLIKARAISTQSSFKYHNTTAVSAQSTSLPLPTLTPTATSSAPAPTVTVKNGDSVDVPIGAVVIGGVGGGWFVVGGVKQPIAAGATTIAGSLPSNDTPEDPDPEKENPSAGPSQPTTPGATVTATTTTSTAPPATSSNPGTTAYIIYPKDASPKEDRDGFYYTLAKLVGEANIDSVLDENDVPIAWLAPLTAQQLTQVDADRVVAATQPNAGSYSDVDSDPDNVPDSTSESSATVSQQKRALASVAPTEQNNILDLRMLATPPGETTLPNYIYDDAAGEGITIYVIDVGPVITHQELIPPEPHITRREIDKTWNVRRLSVKDVQHGTCAVSKTVGRTTGSAKRANLVVVRVSLDPFSMSKGWQAVRDDIKAKGLQGKAVLSTSTGGWLAESADENDKEGMYSMYRTLIRGITRLDVPIVCAAGNDAKKGIMEPHSMPALLSREMPIIVVGSTDREGKPTTFSQRGDLVTTWALGLDVNCPDTRNLKDLTKLRPMNGTSFSAPLVAGVVAVWMSQKNVVFRKGKVAQDARDRVVEYSYKRGDSPEHMAMVWNGWNACPSEPQGQGNRRRKRQDGKACSYVQSATGSAQPTATSSGSLNRNPTTTTAAPAKTTAADPKCGICGTQNGNVYGGRVGCESADWARQSCESDPGCASWAFGTEDRSTYQIAWCGFYDTPAEQVASAAPDSDGKCAFKYSDKGCKP